MPKSKTPKEEEEFPFNNQYYDLLAGKTLSKRGVWWTALLLVKSKGKDTEEGEEEEKSSTKKATTEEKVTKKVIIQRWRRFKQGEDGFRWNRSKDFTISSKNQWSQLKALVDEWVDDGSWE